MALLRRLWRHISTTQSRLHINPVKTHILRKIKSFDNTGKKSFQYLEERSQKSKKFWFQLLKWGFSMPHKFFSSMTYKVNFCDFYYLRKFLQPSFLHSFTPLIKGGMDFLKNHLKRDKKISKKGWDSKKGGDIKMGHSLILL